MLPEWFDFAGEMLLEVNGQPRINFNVKSDAKAVIVNGKPYTGTKKHDYYTIKVHNEK